VLIKKAVEKVLVAKISRTRRSENQIFGGTASTSEVGRRSLQCPQRDAERGERRHPERNRR